jgi:hypothetical protein
MWSSGNLTLITAYNHECNHQGMAPSLLPTIKVVMGNMEEKRKKKQVNQRAFKKSKTMLLKTCN